MTPTAHIEPYWSQSVEDVAIICATDEPPAILPLTVVKR